MSNLYNKRVLITRPRGQAAEFAAALQAYGAVPISFPVIEIGRIEDTICLDRALMKLACYEWLILTSVNGVDAVWERLEALNLTRRENNGIPASLKIAAIGPKTAAAIQQRGVVPAFVPEEYIAEAILPGLGDLMGRWALLTRADLARPALAEAIEAAGGVAHEIVVYRTLPASPDPEGFKALSTGVDIVTFTSSSTVKNFFALVSANGMDPHNLPGNPMIACIGPITAETARQEGFTVDVMADEYTTEGLIKALIKSSLEERLIE